MADTTFGVKVPEELKEQIQRLMNDSGLTGKDFMQQVINTYTVEKTKEQIPTVAEDLKELQVLTQRINNIYLNMGYRIENISKAQEQEKQELLEGKDKLILDLQARNEALKTDNIELENANNELVNLKNEYCKRVNELTDNNNNMKALIEEYKGKNDYLLSELQQYKQYKDQIEEYKKLLADAQGRNAELNDKIKDNEDAISNLTKEISILNTNNDKKLNRLKSDYDKEVSNLKSEHEKIVNEMKNRHSEETKALNDRLGIERDKATLELKAEHQKQVQELQSDSNKLINEYQAKYKSLLEEIEHIKTTHRQSTAKANKQE